ncbi:putative pectinesterase [Helianthus annuus]|nr:putative pectinesterase [Helianthus annuus]KAJ0634832.1 putative pectinesterase [Helianthus annuus]KAJ0824520.1 putative pectinesterase [Helianthus annuus]
MLKTYLILFYSIISLIVFTSCEVSRRDQNPFTELCNHIMGPEFESRDFGIKAMHKTRETLERFLAMPHTMLDIQAKTSLMDCLELYKNVINHLNLSKKHTNAADVRRWLIAAVVNHQTCLNGFKHSNLLRLFEDMLVELEASNSHSPTIHNHGFVQLPEGCAIQANFVVAQDGSGDFSTVTEAIEAAENQRRIVTNRLVIYVKAGIYKENIYIKNSMTNLMLYGDGIDATVITNDKNIFDGLLTSNTATVQVWGQGFAAIGITFENTAGPEKQQAIALLSASDQSIFYKCSFKGNQDTLCLLQNRQFLRECDIYGTIDFIFGDASAVLQNCNIYVRTPLPGTQNTITAQGRIDPSSNTGFVIENSRVMPAPDSNLVDGLAMTYLGRPWRDYSRVVYIKCDLDNVINPAGWLPFRGDSAFDKVYYAEYMNTGQSADTGGRIKWPGYHVLTTEEAEQFSVRLFLTGESWIPETGVPFSSDI